MFFLILNIIYILNYKYKKEHLRTLLFDVFKISIFF
nr:MAG TPA: hypothetical protein [Caudoviricetes sp.]